ncbi:hypothetical protein SAMN05192555_13011 [Franzmannia pantelleriensis]|uniref:Nickel/cobalt transporter regulator n=1 Tax=Franzmannia pantelleriensis TaxID=48727 RepID=A0A1G9XCE8_9GAMM|nr:anti-virulence regulator CigR family protein [Halomonas pantelleriensis]SDM94126.1 hypothetical protein SAMN05192555_13011 [Halomonas pantelleriensis]
MSMLANRSFRWPWLAAGALTLALGAANVQAQGASPQGQPQGASQGQGQGNAQGQGALQGQGQGQRRQQQERSSEPRRESAPRQRRADEPEYHRDRGDRDYRRDGPSLEERVIRRIFEDNRSYVSRDADLPPGIRQNLERGKPLPPGIAKRFDDRLYGQLPRYEGYEWRQAGPDAILVDIANEVVYEILRGVVY